MRKDAAEVDIKHFSPFTIFFFGEIIESLRIFATYREGSLSIFGRRLEIQV
jgi:hypothetical protein